MQGHGLDFHAICCRLGIDAAFSASMIQPKSGEPNMKPIDPSDRRIVNIQNAEFKPFVYPDGDALGDEVLQLDTDKPIGEGFHVYRMPAGMTTRGHRHNGHEQFLILEGELHESDGTILRKGDLVFYRDGTEHHSYTPDGCLLAVHIAGPEIPVD